MELSIDTSTRYASAGLSKEGELVIETCWRSEQNHSVELVPAVRQIMDRAKAAMGDITAVFVARGPGGFSALRVGISTAKALATAQNIPLVAVETLELEARPYMGLGFPVCAVIEAGRKRLYAGYYRESSVEAGDSAEEYQVTTAEELASSVQKVTIFCGEGAGAAADDLRENLGSNALVIEAPPPTRRASVLARLGYRRLEAGETEDPGTMQPLYMRGSQYERAQRQGG